MSEIRANTVSDAAGTGPATLTGQSAAKAWAFFDGTGTPSLDGSLNVSTLTDNGTGSYFLAWTNAMSDANYASTGAGRSIVLTGAAAVQTTTNVRVSVVNSSNTNVDDTNNSVAVHGDLA